MKNLGKRQGIFSLFDIKRAVFACAVLFCAVGAFGASYTWTGGASDGNWITHGNWETSPDVVATDYPRTNADTAIFTADATATLPATLTVGTITADGVLTITGSPALTATAITGTGSVTGTNTTLSLPLGGELSADGGITIASMTSNGTTTIGTNITSTEAQIYYNPVSLVANKNIQLQSTDNVIAFGGVITGDTSQLTLDADTQIRIRGNTSLESLSVTSASIEFYNAITITTAGVQNYTGALTLLGSPTFIAPGSSVTFDGTINGNYALTIGSAANVTNVNFTGVVGGSTALSTINVSGSTAIGANVTTNGAQTYTGAVTLSGPSTLRAGSSNIIFSSTINGANSLTLNTSGVVTFGGNVGNSTQLSSLDVTAGTINTGSSTTSITTTGDQTYNGTVTSIDGVNFYPGGNVSFFASGNSLQGSWINIVAVGNVELNGSIDTGSSLRVTASGSDGIQINTATITTSGEQVYTSLVTLVDDIIMDSDKHISFSGNITGAHSLTIVVPNNERIIFGGYITYDSDEPPNEVLTYSSITVGISSLIAGESTRTSDIHLNANITTTEEQTYNGEVTLGGDTALTSTGGTVDLNGTVNGAQTLNIDATTVTLVGVVGGSTALTALNIGATTSIAINQNVSASTQTYDAPAVTLGASATTLTGDVILPARIAQTFTIGAATTITGNLNTHTEGSKTVTLAIDTHTLDIAGFLNATATDSTYDADIDVTGAGTLTMGSFDTAATGTHSLSAPNITTLTVGTRLWANTDAGTLDITIDAPASTINLETVTLGGSADAALTINGDVVNFNDTVAIFNDDAGGSLTVTGTTSVTFANTVGSGASTFDTLSVTADAINIDGGSVTTLGAQTYTGAVQRTSSGNIALNAGTGTVTFSEAVGTNILTFEVTASTINVNGGAVTTTGNQTYNGNVTRNPLGAVALNASSANITFGGNITLGTNTLSLTAGTLSFVSVNDQIITANVNSFNTFAGDIIIDTIVDASTTHTLTFENGFTQKDTAPFGDVSLAGNIVATNGGLSFSGATTLTDATVLTAENAGNITFTESSSLNTDGSTLTLTAADDTITFGCDISGGNALTLNADTLAFIGRVPTAPITAQMIAADFSAFAGNIDINTGGNEADRETIFSNGFTQTGGGDVSLRGTINAQNTGAFSFAGATTIAANTSLSTNNGNVTFRGTVTSAEATITAGEAGDITFADTSSLDTTGELTLNAEGDTVTLGCNITGAQTFTINATTLAFIGRTFDEANPDGQSIDVASFNSFAGAVEISSGGNDHKTTFLKGFNQTEDGAVTIRGHVVASTGGLSFTGNVSLSGTANLTATNQAVAFGGTLTGLVPLTVAAGTGTVTFSEATSNIGALEVTASTINVSGGQVQTHARDIDIGAGAAHATTGNQTYNGNVVLGANTLFTMNGSSSTVDDEVILFNGTVNGDTTGRSFTVTGAEVVTLGGEVGTTNAISSVDITASATSNAININGGAVTTTGAQTYTGFLRTGDATSLESTGSGNASVITFEDSISSNYALTVTSNYGVSFANGENVNVGAFTVEAKAGGVSFGSSLGMHGATSISAIDNGNITFSSLINNAQPLTVSASTGNVTFAGAVGGNTPLDSVDVTANAINVQGGQVSTTGTQNYRGAVTVSTNAASLVSTGTGANGNITFHNASTLTTALRVVTTGAVSFADAVNGTNSLTVHGDTTDPTSPASPIAKANSVTFANRVGSLSGVGTNLSSVTIDATNIYVNGGSVTTTETQEYNGIVGRTAPAGDLSFVTGTVSGNAITFNGAVTGNINALFVTGYSINVNGGRILTAQGQTYTGQTAFATNNATLTANTENISFSNNVTVNIGTTVTATAGVATFGRTVNGGNSLTVNSNHATSITNFADSVSVGALDVNALAGGVSFGNTVTLNENATISATGGNIDFDNTIDGANQLSVTATEVSSAGGTVAFSGAIGTTTALSALSVTANTINVNGGTVSTENNQTYNGPVSIGTRAATLSTSAGGDIDFQNTVALGQNLSVTTGGDVDFDMAVTSTSTRTLNVTNSANLNFRSTVGSDATRLGATTLTDITTTIFSGGVYTQSLSASSTTININGGTVTTSGAQTYTGDVTIRTNAAILASTNAGSIDFNNSLELEIGATIRTTQNISFDETVDGTFPLVITGYHATDTAVAANTVTFGGAVGGVAGAATNLTSLSVNANTIAINGGVVSTTGNQTYGSGAGAGDVSIGTETTLTARNAPTNDATITFKNDVTRTGSADFALEVDSNIATFSNTTTAANSPIVFIGDSMTVTYGTHNADIYIDLDDGANFNLGGDLQSNNLYFYNGNLYIAARSIRTGNFAIFGSAYNATDRGWHEANTRFAYYGYDSLVYKDDNLNDNTKTTSFPDLGGKTITVTGNFYNNGAHMNPGTGWTLNIPANESPTSNNTNLVTELQWGRTYAVAFNMTVANGTAEGGWVAAATDIEGQNVTDGNGNTNWQFESPVLSNVYVTTDRTLDFGFKTPGDGTNGLNVYVPENAETLSLYDGEASAFSTITKNDTTNIITSTAATDDSWNTDTVGAVAVNADSTNRSGEKRATNNDVSIMKGAFYHSQGNTMSRSIGYGVQEGDVTLSPTYTDQAQPVLAAVYTGQEAHTTGVGAMPYDAHNFIELRYSEPVNFDNAALDDDSQVNTNIRATAELGHAPNNNSVFELSGLMSASGSIETGNKTEPTNLFVNALYRKFNFNGTGVNEFQPHRLRVSIAGFMDGQVTIGSLSVNNYPGYIDSATNPNGAVTVLENLNIKDASNNVLDHTNSFSPTINSTVTGLYSPWDASPPSFAHVAWDNTSDYEILAVPDAAGVSVDRFEFHFHDNTLTYAASVDEDERWVNGDGWGESVPRNVLDTVGGSRPNYRASASGTDTGGGLRISSMDGITDSFTILETTTGTAVADGSFETSRFQRYIFDTTFFSTGTQGLSLTDDTLYLTMYPNSTDLDPTLQYKISYDDSISFVTDLAGNRLDAQTIESANLVAPLITLTLAPYTETSGNQEVFIYFNKALDLDTGGSRATISNMPGEFTFYTTEDDSSLISDLFAESARIAFTTETSTGLILTLNRALKKEELFSINVKPSDGEALPAIFGVNGAQISRTGRFPVTYFGVNAVRPLNVITPLDFNIDTPPSTEDVTIMNFDGSKSVYAHRDIAMQVHVENTIVPLNDAQYIPKLHISASETPISYTERYKEETGQDITFWMPSYDDPASVFSANYNDDALEFAPTNSTQGGLENYTFNISVDQMDRESGYGAQFLFEMGEIRTSEDGNLSDVPNTPLYHISIPDLTDLQNFSMFAFNFFEDTQRGGATILNNVINVNEKEETVLEVILPIDGSLNVSVLTADGNVVKVLSRGRKAAGNHYFLWDGTNNAGNPVARGIYFVRIVGPGVDETRKVMAVKE